MRLLGRQGTNGEPILGFPITWIAGGNTNTAAALPAPPLPPDAVARMPTSTTSETPGETTVWDGFDFDWSNHHSDLDGDHDFQVIADMHRHNITEEHCL